MNNLLTKKIGLLIAIKVAELIGLFGIWTLLCYIAYLFGSPKDFWLGGFAIVGAACLLFIGVIIIYVWVRVNWEWMNRKFFRR